MAREITLKTVEIEKNGNKEQFDYKKYIERILDTPLPNQGFSLGEVRLCNKIQKVLDSTENGSLILEENLWNHLKKKLEPYQWGIPHPEIEVFADAILNAKSVNIKKQ